MPQKTKIVWLVPGKFVIRDLKAYTIDIDRHLSYYHDRYDLEADWVLHLGDGRYAVMECKLGSKEIEDGAGHLVELKRLIREHNKKAAGKREKSDACIDSSEREQAGPKVKETQVPIREPDLMIVLTGGKMAYTRPDGVKIIPLGCLKD